MKTEFDRAYVTAHGKVAVLTLNHPEAMNAAGVKLVKGAYAALNFVEDPKNGFRAMVLTGEGRGFCSGANLAERGTGEDPGVGHALENTYHPFLRKLRDLPIPFVTAVNGAAAGVGMSIALMGDLVVASKSAYFLQAFTRIGLVPDGGSTWLLPRLIGLARAKELSLLAERLPAEKAVDWGLINRVVGENELMEEALKLANQLAEGPASLAITRSLYWQSPLNSYEEQLDLERISQERAGKTEDFREGVSAFLQKRQAKFAGK
ncbi:MAG: enoyl-CoA hydratase/isomerase [Alphaproteobacteria bacterium]|nr:enoyl-CoA hydratase/isomerase [Alphaproteobacteria bacterium]MBL6939273.1 enoyl-CoA hydratase/isomerase [Alphaproteobacteria bacterium]MBL7096789.1 enoyl-CoA hydratase/isomerase [Alphaproteobacteria bacterium]